LRWGAALVTVLLGAGTATSSNRKYEKAVGRKCKFPFHGCLAAFGKRLLYEVTAMIVPIEAEVLSTTTFPFPQKQENPFVKRINNRRSGYLVACQPLL
jgi:hypothetical protein